MSTAAPSPAHGSTLSDWVGRVLAGDGLLSMGHNQCQADGNLGLGWLYYALARILRPTRAVVIGSFRGFVPLTLARGMADNGNPGEVTFIDPSMVDEFWTDEAAVRQHFASYGLTNIHHHLMTTQEFVQTAAYRALGAVDLLFIDGYHTAEQARYDHEAFRDRLGPYGVALFHDSMDVRRSRIYGDDRTYDVSVSQYIDEVRSEPGIQVFDLPFGTGLTLVRQSTAGRVPPRLEGTPGRPRQ